MFITHKSNKSLSAASASLFLIFAIFIYCLLFIWHGIDITDTGFHLTQQSNILSGDIAGWPVNWPVDLIAGAFLTLFDSCGLICARLLWVFLICFTGFVTFFTLKNAFNIPSSEIAVNVFLTALVSTSSGLMLAHYYNIPAAGALLVVGAMLWLFGESKNLRLGRTYVVAVIIGIGLTTVSLLRPPNVIIGIIPFIFYIMLNQHKKEKIFPFIVVIFASVIVSSLIIVSVAYINDVFYPYLNAIADVGSKRTSSLIVYKRQLELISWTIFQLVVLIIISILLHFGLNRRFRLWIVPSVIVGGIIYIVYHSNDLWIVIFSLFIIFIIPTFLYILFKEDNSNKTTKIFQYSFAALILLSASFLGSSGGMKKLLYGSWLAIPLLILIPIYLSKINSDRATRLGFTSSVVRLYIYPAVICLSIFGFTERLTSIYRDDDNRFNLSYSIDHPKLRGIFTTKGRAKSLKEVLSEIESRTSPGDKILIYNSAPLLYYLTGTKPVTDLNWLVIGNITEERIKKLFKNICISSDLPQNIKPRIIVEAVTNPRNKNWGNGRIYPVLGKANSAALGWVKDEVDRCEPSLVWTNGEFSIFIPEY